MFAQGFVDTTAIVEGTLEGEEEVILKEVEERALQSKCGDLQSKLLQICTDCLFSLFFP